MDTDSDTMSKEGRVTDENIPRKDATTRHVESAASASAGSDADTRQLTPSRYKLVEDASRVVRVEHDPKPNSNTDQTFSKTTGSGGVALSIRLPSLTDNAVLSKTSPMADFVQKLSLSSTDALVSALNALPEKERHDLVPRFLEAYDSAVKNLDSKDLTEAVWVEYAQLTQLKLAEASAKNIIRGWLASLTELLQKDAAINGVLTVLDSLVGNLDGDVLEGDMNILMNLVITLIEKINSAADVDQKDERKTHGMHWRIFCTIYGIFRQILTIKTVDRETVVAGDAFQKSKMKIDAFVEEIEKNFCVFHYINRIRQGMIDLESEEAIMRPIPFQIRSEASSIANCCLFGYRMLMGTYDASLEEAVGRFDEATIDEGGRSWIRRLNDLDSLGYYLLIDANNLQIYLKRLGIMIERVRKMKDMNERKHLRYGIVEHLMVMMTQSLPTAKIELTERFSEVVLMNGDTLSEDPGFVGRVEVGKMIVDVIEKERKKERDADGQNHSMEQALRSETLFSKAVSRIEARTSSSRLGSSPWEKMESMMRMTLKAHYQSNVQVTSYGLNGADISTVVCRLMRIEDRNQIFAPSIRSGYETGRTVVPREFKREIQLDAIFRGNDAEQVLVLGAAGVGKSLLARRLAIGWADGTWGHAFQTVFVLPVGALVESVAVDIAVNPSLPSAIVDICFSHLDRNDTLSDFVDCIERALHQSSTLLILDGLDESKMDPTGRVQSIVQQALSESYGCHRLLLSRPIDIAEIVSSSVEVMELDELNEEDVVEYLSTDDAIVRRQLEANKYLWSLVRNPRNLEIVRRMMTSPPDHDRSHPKSLAWVLEHLSCTLWEHHRRKWPDKGEEMEDVFVQSEKIALRCLELGRCSVSLEDLRDDDVTAAASSMMTVGFSSFQGGDNVTFAHGAMMLYFASRRLVRWLSADDASFQQASIILQRLKYAEETSGILHFMTGILGRDADDTSIRKLLSVVDDGDREPHGLPRLKLKASILQEYFLGDVRSRDIQSVVHACKISIDFKEWTEKAIKQARKEERYADCDVSIIRHIVVTCPDVVRTFGQEILLLMLNEVRRRRWNVHRSVVELLGSLVDLNPEDAVWREALQSVRNDPSSVVRQSFVRSVGFLTQSSKQSITLLLDTLNELGIHSGGTFYCSSLIQLLKNARDYIDDRIVILKDLCDGADYFERVKLRQALREILKDAPERTRRLVMLLIEVDVTNLTPCAIDMLDICLETDAAHVTDAVDFLLQNWRKMYEDTMMATAQTLSTAIKIKPDKTEIIISDLMTEKEDIPWTASIDIMHVLLSSMNEMPSHVDVVARILLERHSERKDDIRSLELILTVVCNNAKLSINILKLCLPFVWDPLVEKEWKLRRLSYRAIGALVRRDPNLTPENALDIVMDACHKEKAWKALCSAFEALKEFAIAGVRLEDSIEICQKTLGHDDDDIRRRAAEALYAATREDGRSRIEELSKRYWKAVADEKHGILYCLHLFLRSDFRLTPTMAEIFVDASEMTDRAMSELGIACLGMAVPSEDDLSRYVVALEAACKKKEGSMQFTALDGLLRSARRNPAHRPSVLRVLRTSLDPLNDKDRAIYLSALEYATTETDVGNIDLLRLLLKESSEESSDMMEARTSTIDRIPSKSLFDWYDISQEPLLVKPIVDRFREMPITMKPSNTDTNTIDVYIFDVHATQITERSYKDLSVAIRRAGIERWIGDRIGSIFGRGLSLLLHFVKRLRP